MSGRRGAPISCADAVEVVDRLERAGLTVWLDGGWGVDALIGRQTRPHDDLDLVVLRAELGRARAALPEFAHDPHVEPGLPARLVLRDPAGRQVDFHPIDLDDEGNGWQDLGDGERAFYPRDGLSARGRLGARRVRCLSASLQLAHHSGYEPDEIDFRDMSLLARHTGLELPPAYERGPGWTDSRRRSPP